MRADPGSTLNTEICRTWLPDACEPMDGVSISGTEGNVGMGLYCGVDGVYEVKCF
jgi:hypothetical protein